MTNYYDIISIKAESPEVNAKIGQSTFTIATTFSLDMRYVFVL